MFEAKLAEGHIFKKIVEAIKDLVTDVNIDVSPSGKLNNLHPKFYRSLTPSYGHFPCCIGFTQPQHGGIRVLQMRFKRRFGSQHR